MDADANVNVACRGPKSNSDFRRLLSTPARASTDGDDRGRFRRPAKPTGRLYLSRSLEFGGGVQHLALHACLRPSHLPARCISDLEDHEQQKEKERKAKENKARHKMYARFALRFPGTKLHARLNTSGLLTQLLSFATSLCPYKAKAKGGRGAEVQGSREGATRRCQP